MPEQTCRQCGEPLEPDARFCRACGTAVSAVARRRAPHRPTRAARPSSRLPLVLLIVGVAALLLAFVLNRAGQEDVVNVPDEHDAAGLPYPDVPRISVAETRERFDEGTAIIVDVRSAQNYAEAHIPDALSLPLAELQSRYQELPRAAEIITYCT